MTAKVHVNWHRRNVRAPAMNLSRKSEREIADLTAPVWFDDKHGEWNVRMARRPGGIIGTHVVTRKDIAAFYAQGYGVHEIGRLGPIRANTAVLDKLVNQMEKQAK